MNRSKAFEIGGTSIPPGSRTTIALPMAKLYTHNENHPPAAQRPHP